ncbi:response regulator [Nakamurella sp. YIM 132087]|uniref:Response regulator n=1 Tax=Nakamurella alba TaxID=2665158 RepID=A0A7K1FF30_9ACTN|nr:LytTR family DNA-binding domain-containing protein [Nakamurella alba]MTD12690.1 response regulator [Nakamurella alba]
MTALAEEGLVVLAVDDEEPALAELVHQLSRDPRITTVRTAHDATGALRELQDRSTPVPDAVFLDIRMPGLDGMELARVIAELRTPPAVVFVSAHDERAVEAYDIGAVDYVLKPIRAQRLTAAVDRVSRLTRSGTADREQRAAPADETIAVELAGATRLIPRSTVCWVEAQGDYARLHVQDGSSHLLRAPISTLQQRWEAAGFVRVHRSFLVDLARITELRAMPGGHQVTLGNHPRCPEIPVARRHLKELKDRLFAADALGRAR